MTVDPAAATKAKLVDLQSEFRRQTRNLPPELVRRCHPWNFTEPCQVVDIWIKPEDLHLITIVRHAKAEDGRMEVRGPVEFEGLVQAMEDSLQDPIWQAPVALDQDSLFVLPPPVDPDGLLLLHQLQVDYLAGNLKQISALLYHKRYRQDGLGSYSATIQELSHLEWFGDLAGVSAEDLIARMVSQATYDYKAYLEYQQRVKDAPVAPPAQVVPQEPWEGWWTCLHPGITIGPQKPRSLWAAFVDRPVELSDTARSEIQQVPTAPIRFTSQGYVLVDSPDERRARRCLNHIVFLLGRRGLTVRVIGSNHLAGFLPNDETREFPSGPFQSWTTPADPTRQKPTSAADDLFRWIDANHAAHISQDDFLALATRAWHLSASDWANEVEWLVDAEAHAVEGRNSASLLTAWIGIERITFGLLDRELKRVNVPHPVCADIGRKRYQEAVRLARDLGVQGAPLPSEVEPLVQLRNRVAHQGYEATGQEAAVVRDLLRRLLAPLVDAEIQRLMDKNRI